MYKCLKVNLTCQVDGILEFLAVLCSMILLSSKDQVTHSQCRHYCTTVNIHGQRVSCLYRGEPYRRGPLLPMHLDFGGRGQFRKSCESTSREQCGDVE